MAHDGQTRRARQHHADLPAFPRPGAEPGRERLAVPPPELALKHRLRKLRRDRRRRMRRLAKAHRSTRNNHLHRNARLGSPRSDAMTLGIMPLPRPFDGFVEHAKRVSPTCLIHLERNRYSVPASFANRPVRALVRTGWTQHSRWQIGRTTELASAHENGRTLQ